MSNSFSNLIIASHHILLIFVLKNVIFQIVLSGKPVHSLPKGSSDLAANHDDSTLDGEFQSLVSRFVVLNPVGNCFSNFLLEIET